MSDMVRVLFTSVGRRVELMQAFRDASLYTGIPLRLYGVDMELTAPALMWCDVKNTICRISDDSYIPQLLDMCERNQIDILIPTIDTDLMKLAEARESFESVGTKVLIADSDKVGLCRDKRLTGDFFEACGVNAPRAYDNWEEYPGPYPCFIKPKDGSSSIDAYRVENREQLKQFASRVTDYIVQPFVSGREYTIDAFCDYEGEPISIVPRERIAVRAGEVLKTRIDLDDKMIREAEAIIRGFRPRGPITIQLIRDTRTSEDWFIEINPRYGGGAPLSMKAGARSAEWVLELAQKGRCELSKRTKVFDNAVYCRFDQSVVIHADDSIKGIKGIIFDLDDTLYLEREYVRSGFEEIANKIGGQETFDELWTSFLNGEQAIDVYVKRHKCIAKKAWMLEVYRGHKPRISLDVTTRKTLTELKSAGIRLGVITDGRPIGQHNKITALGLDCIVDDIIITDELGGPQFRKPCDIAFRIMQRKWHMPSEQIVYIGDNLHKDRIATQQLGIQFIYYHNEGGLYYRDIDRYQGITIRTFEELLDVLE